MLVSALGARGYGVRFAIIGAVALTTGIVLGIDLARIVVARGGVATAELAAPLRDLSLALQYARTIVAVALFAVCWRGAAPGPDRRLMPAIALLILVADALIILAGELVLGVMTFLVVQLLLLTRHGRGITATLRDPVTRRPALLTYAVLLALLALSAPILQGPLIAKGLFVPLGVYGLVLAVSVGLALTSGLSRALPSREARFAGIGMAFFALCDFTVALGAGYAGTLTGLVADATTGIVYGPALVLLALSIPRR